MELTILHTNDFHGTLTAPKALFIAGLDRDLYADCGDCNSAGNLAIPFGPDPAWPLLASAGCDVGTMGNRETHLLESAFETKIKGHQHPLLVANLAYRDGREFTPGSLIIERKGVKIGLVGVMVAMVTDKMLTQKASAFLWQAPIPVAVRLGEELRPQVDVLIALTHIGFPQDRKLAEACPHFDLILGGHSHTLIPQPEHHGNTWICQTGSHGKFVGRYVWDVGVGLKHAELIALPATIGT